MEAYMEHKENTQDQFNPAQFIQSGPEYHPFPVSPKPREAGLKIRKNTGNRSEGGG